MDITIIRTSSHGDIVLTEPIFEALKKEGFHTTLITKEQYYPLIKNNPYLDNVIFTKNLKEHNTDILVDLQKNPLSGRLIRMIKAHKFSSVKKYYVKRMFYVGFHKKPDFPNVITRYREAVENAIEKKLILNKLRFFPAKQNKIKIEKPFITLALSSKWFTKSYPFIDELIDILMKNTDFNIAFIGKNKTSIINPRFIDLSEKYPIDEGAAIIKDSKFIVTVDSLWMHIGLGLGIKTYAVFGSTTPQLGFVSPYNMPHKIIEEDLKCRPCTRIGKKKCPKRHFKCMNSISPMRIWESIKDECNS